MTQSELQATLASLADEKYRIFNSRLMPGTQNVLGVRMPALRAIARRIAREDWRAYLAEATEDSYEELLLQGLVIGYVRASWQTLAPYIAAHVEKLHNWATCDVFCGSLKICARHADEAWAFVQPYFESDAPYALRFAIVMCLSHFLDEAHLDDVLIRLNAVRHDDYYVKMAVAWAVSMAYVAMPERVAPFLSQNRLDDWTHNKALQKIIESRQVNDATREAMRALKRPKGGNPCAETTAP